MIQAIVAVAALLAAGEAENGGAPVQGAPLNAPKPPSRSHRVEDLLANGFTVVKDTKVVGDFEGCDYGREVPLAGGGTFTCNGFGYMHASSPKAVLLRSADGRQYKLVIENAVFDGAYL